MTAALRILLPLAVLAVLALGAFAVFSVVDRLSVAERAAERRALLTREVELSRIALAPGSALACLDGGAGETVENVCEKTVFASAQSTAAAVAYMDARLKLLGAAAAGRDPGLLALLASTRRAVTLDRFGLAAHVLAIRDGCTAEKCDAFALVDDAGALQANLRAQVYDQYVSRYVASWNAPAPAEKAPAVSALPSPTSPVRLTASGQTAIPAVKPGEHWDFPSAASIPPVSIMGAEPPLPKGAEAQAQVPAQAPGQAEGALPAAPAAKPAANPAAKPAAAPKTPPPQAAPPAAR